MDKQTVDLQPNSSDWALARNVHAEFARKSGAQHIATEFALAHLSALVRTANPTKVLEFGAGIGTISQLLLNHPNTIGHLTATESNGFCIDALTEEFCGRFSGRFDLVTDPKCLDLKQRTFDLVVIDGLLEPEQFDALKEGSFCFVEGSRKSTRKTISQELQRRNLTITFVNYNRGVRYFDWSMQHPDGRARRFPKFKFRKVLKGCWVGKVSGPSAA